VALSNYTYDSVVLFAACDLINRHGWSNLGCDSWEALGKMLEPHIKRIPGGFVMNYKFNKKRMKLEYKNDLLALQ
jgi:hypothetical protein